MRTSALFGAKNFGCLEIYDVSAWTRGERGQIFAILCGRPLWTAPKASLQNSPGFHLWVQDVGDQ